MSRPKPLQMGDQKHLTWGSTRWSIARQMRLGVEMNGDANGQYRALLAGADVVLTREQVAGLVPQTRRPADLDRWPLWLLRGDDALVPAS
jgi:hypothetical protein